MLDYRKRFITRQRQPPVQVRRTDSGTDNKKGQGDEHIDLSLPHGIQGTRTAAATQLHADTKQEGPCNYRSPHRRQRRTRLDRGEHLTKQGEKQQRRESQQ